MFTETVRSSHLRLVAPLISYSRPVNIVHPNFDVNLWPGFGGFRLVFP